MDSQLKTRELCLQGGVPEKEIFKLMTLKKVCEMIAKLGGKVYAPKNADLELLDKYEKLKKKHEKIALNNYELGMDNLALKKQLDKFWEDSNKEKLNLLKETQRENLEYRTRNEKLTNELHALKVKIADLKAKKLSVEQDYRLDKKRLKNLLKMGEEVEEAEIKTYKREIQQLKTTCTTLRRGTLGRDAKIKAQAQELRMRASEITRLKNAVAQSFTRKRK